MLRIIFPDAFQATPGWVMALVWLAIFYGGIMAIWSCFGASSNHFFPWEIRMFTGVLVCYASAAGFINKLIANGIL